MLPKFFWTTRRVLIFPREILLVAKSYKVLALNIKSMIISAVDTLEMRLKVPILAIFWRLWAFFELSLVAQTFSLGHNNQHNASQIFLKSAIWSGPYKMPFSGLLIRKTWNLVSV